MSLRDMSPRLSARRRLLQYRNSAAGWAQDRKRATMSFATPGVEKIHDEAHFGAQESCEASRIHTRMPARTASRYASGPSKNAKTDSIPFAKGHLNSCACAFSCECFECRQGPTRLREALWSLAPPLRQRLHTKKKSHPYDQHRVGFLLRRALKLSASLGGVIPPKC